MKNRFRGESKRHREAKKRAKAMLMNTYHFSQNEIFEEYRVVIKGKVYYVDVIGKRRGFKVAVECGRTKLKKLVDLREIFNIVEHISRGRRGRRRFTPIIETKWVKDLFKRKWLENYAKAWSQTIKWLKTSD